MEKKIIVVGASSGIGAAIAEQLLKQGNSVVLVARRDKELKKIADISGSGKAVILKNDVTEFAKVDSAFKKAVKELGGLDEIYFASGIMEEIAPEEYNTTKDIAMLNTNLLGATAWLNPAAAYFTENKKGKIIGISSIAGDRGRVGNPVYNASKAGFNTYLEALRNRLNKKGIQVVTVKPGFIDTDMTKGRPGLFWLISAEKAAKIILANTDSNKEEFYVPARWGLIGFIIKNIPSFIFKKLSI